MFCETRSSRDSTREGSTGLPGNLTPPAPGLQLGTTCLLRRPQRYLYGEPPDSFSLTSMPESSEARLAAFSVWYPLGQCQDMGSDRLSSVVTIRGCQAFKTPRSQLFQFPDQSAMKPSQTSACRPPPDFAVKSGKQPSQTPMTMTLPGGGLR